LESNKYEIIRPKRKVDLEQLTKDIFENFPEAAMCIACRSWSYGDKFKFVFEDIEDDKKYTIDLEKAKNATRIFIEDVWDGNYSVGSEEDILDLCNWDAWTFDAVAQIACFGEVLYG